MMYKKTGIIEIGSDKLQLDSPSFEVVGFIADLKTGIFTVEVMHYATQGTVTQQHSRSFTVNLSDLPATVKQAGKTLTDAIETELLKLPQYQGATNE